MIDIKISSKPLDITACIGKVTTSKCGGINVFIGAVREVTAGKRVVRLEYEAYESMAMKEMEKIAIEAQRRWPAERILIHHRTGVLQLEESAVVIAVAAPHRDAAFQACRFAIDQLKQNVPIWKKEVFEDGEVWVAAHP